MKLLKETCLLFLGVISCLYASAQSPPGPVDSLKQLLVQAPPDTARVRLLNALGQQYITLEQLDSASLVMNQAFALADSLHDRRGTALTYTTRGRIGNAEGNYLKAISDYQEAMQVYEELDDPKNIAHMYNLIANAYHLEGDFPAALKNQFNALKIRESIGDEEGISWSYNNLATIYRIQGDYDSALKNYAAALKIMQKVNDQSLIAVVYSNFGNVYALQGKYIEALNNYISSLKIRLELGDRKEIIASYLNTGDAFSDLYEYYTGSNEVQVTLSGNSLQTIPRSNWLDTAMSLQMKAHKMIEGLGIKYYSIFSLSNMGRIHFLRKNYNESIRLYREAYTVADELQAEDLQKEISKYLADNYQQLGDYKNSLEWYAKYTSHKDSMLKQSNSEELIKIRMKFEFEKKESEAKALQDKKEALARMELVKQKKMRNLFLAGFVLVLSFAGIFFYQRNNIRKEKTRSDNLLLNILPAEIAGELKQTGAAKAKSFPQVTVLFADIVGFTSISEQFSPEALVKELHSCFSAFDGILQKYRIEKIKTIGDAYMAAGGLPVPTEDSVKRTVLAALDMQHFIATRKKDCQDRKIPPFEMRVGIHTGSVVAGIVGVKKFQYDIWGDTVNTASRLEGSGAVGKVNVSESTYQLIRDDSDFVFESRGKIEVKGKGQLAMWFVEKA